MQWTEQGVKKRNFDNLLPISLIVTCWFDNCFNLFCWPISYLDVTPNAKSLSICLHSFSQLHIVPVAKVWGPNVRLVRPIAWRVGLVSAGWGSCERGKRARQLAIGRSRRGAQLGQRCHTGQYSMSYFFHIISVGWPIAIKKRYARKLVWDFCILRCVLF